MKLATTNAMPGDMTISIENWTASTRLCSIGMSPENVTYMEERRETPGAKEREAVDNKVNAWREGVPD